MARQEVYTTVIKLNSEEAKNRLKELEDRVARLKKAKQDAFSAGDSRLGASLAKDLEAGGGRVGAHPPERAEGGHPHAAV